MHTWQFSLAGGFSQVTLDRGVDFAALAGLDQKLWVALACPVEGVEFDPHTLALLDGDGDGRIRAPELLAAIEWTLARLSSPDELLAGSPALPLAAIDTTQPAGATLEAAARRVLREMGREGDSALDLDSALGAAELLAGKPLNGDGVVMPASTGDVALQALIETAIAAGFGTIDRSGEPGLAADGLGAFQTAAEAVLAWRALATPEPAASAAAVAAVDAVGARVDDFFARCALARFDARAEAALNREEGAWLALAARDLSIDTDEIRSFPLARVTAGGDLPLTGSLNPAWAGAVATLVSDAITPLLGARASLAEADWRSLLAQLEAYRTWSAGNPYPALDGASDADLQAAVTASQRAAMDLLIAADLELAPAYDALTDLVRLIRLRRDLAGFCRNFVNFQDFYGAETAASFQCGTLFIDQRSCSLCLRVADAGKHVALAGLAGAYLAYCNLSRPGGESMQIVAAVTDGDAENLLVGRNGIFYDRAGRDWDATITRIVDNPISVRQAFWNPYRKVARFIEEQVAKRAASADSAAADKLQTTVVTLPAEAAAPPAVGAPPPPARRIDVGTVAALGVALGSIGTAFGYFLKTIADIKAWQFPLAIAGILLAISGPAMILAWLKLRRRNIAPLLDASGWAVNGRALVNVPFGATLTTLATLPVGASLGGDKYAVKGSSSGRLAVLIFIVWWGYAFLSDQGYLQALLAR
jgi:hypothetical protein